MWHNPTPNLWAWSIYHITQLKVVCIHVEQQLQLIATIIWQKQPLVACVEAFVIISKALITVPFENQSQRQCYYLKCLNILLLGLFLGNSRRKRVVWDRVWQIYLNIRIFKYFWFEYLFGYSFISFFGYEYIRIFVRVNFLDTNIFGYSFVARFWYEYIRIFVRTHFQIPTMFFV